MQPGMLRARNRQAPAKQAAYCKCMRVRLWPHATHTCTAASGLSVAMEVRRLAGQCLRRGRMGVQTRGCRRCMSWGWWTLCPYGGRPPASSSSGASNSPLRALPSTCPSSCLASHPSRCARRSLWPHAAHACTAASGRSEATEARRPAGQCVHACQRCIGAFQKIICRCMVARRDKAG
jgi:hypothetical protein